MVNVFGRSVGHRKVCLLTVAVCLACFFTSAQSEDESESADYEAFEKACDATYAGDLSQLRALIDSGANLEVKKNGLTPLLSSSYVGLNDAVKLLLEAGADVNATSQAGNTSLMFAACNRNVEVVKLLLDAKADVNAVNENKETPLIGAAASGDTEIVKLLLAAKADENALDEDGQSPLFVAAMLGHTEVVKLMIKAKAHVDQANNGGVTPLWIAASEGHAEVVKLLISAGADVNAKASRGGSETYTPLGVAKHAGHDEVVKLLISAGANVDTNVNRGGIKVETIIPLGDAKRAGHTKDAQLAQAQRILISLVAAIEEYQMETGNLPQNLDALLDTRYMKKKSIPVDPWGNPFVYTIPGVHNTHSYDLYASGHEDEVNNWH